MFTLETYCERCRFTGHEPPFYAPYDQWSSHYVPESGIRYLFVAESPAYFESGERPYIYNVNYVGQGFLLNGILGALKLVDSPISIRTPKHKEGLLRKLVKAGCFLVDAARCPVNQVHNRKLRNEIISDCSKQFLIKRIEELKRVYGIDRILLIKYNVYDTLLGTIRERFPKEIVDLRLPFPCCGWQEVFKQRLKQVLGG